MSKAHFALWSLLLLPLRAHALAVLPSFDLAGAVPEDGATIPQNAHVFVWGSADATLTASLDVAGDARAVPLELHRAAWGVVAELDLGALPPGEEVVLLLADDLEVLLLTYTVADDADDTPPVFRDVPFSDSGYEGQRTWDGSVAFTFSYAGPPADDDHQVVMYEAIRVVEGTDEILDRTRATADAPSGTELFWFGPEEQRCFTVAAVDVAGNRTRLDDELCVDFAANVPGIVGCACTTGAARPAPVVAVLLVVGLFVPLRRRRTR